MPLQLDQKLKVPAKLDVDDNCMKHLGKRVLGNFRSKTKELMDDIDNAADVLDHGNMSGLKVR